VKEVKNIIGGGGKYEHKKEKREVGKRRMISGQKEPGLRRKPGKQRGETRE